jgi:DNA-binding transcriptional LysR family regulator
MDVLTAILRSPRALLISAAAVRNGSCSGAAREFNITQPSVSRNVAQLEAAVGATLLVRRRTGVEPTANGLLLYRTIADAMHGIAGAIDEISRNRERRQVVVLSLSTAIVTHWFVPRMQQFQAAFPDVDWRFELTSGALKGPPGSVDLAMRRTDSGEGDEHTFPFIAELVLPVASGSYFERYGLLDEPPAGREHVLLELTGTEIGWQSVLGSAAKRRSAGNWVEFSDYAVVLQTAISGQGIALVWVSAISHTLATGTLVPASERRLVTGRHFCLIAPRGRPLRSTVLAIRDWMIEEMRRERRLLAPILAPAEPGRRRGRWPQRRSPEPEGLAAGSPRRAQARMRAPVGS